MALTKYDLVEILYQDLNYTRIKSTDIIESLPGIIKQTLGSGKPVVLQEVCVSVDNNPDQIKNTKHREVLNDL